MYKPRSYRRIERRGKRNLFLSIILVLIFGFVLINWGIPYLISGLSLFNKLKPSTKQEQVSENLTLAPPVLNIPFEATNTATIKISGYATPNAKVELYLDEELRETINTNESGNFVVESFPLTIGNNSIYGKTLDDKNQSSLPSKSIKVYYTNEKPKLELSEPTDGHQIKGGDKKVRVSGSTDPGNNVTVNGITAIVNSEGNFVYDLSINEGDNQIVVISSNSVVNTTSLERKVNYAP